MKYPQYILAVKNNVVSLIENALNSYFIPTDNNPVRSTVYEMPSLTNTVDIFTTAGLVISRREEMEQDKSLRQVLPYTTIKASTDRTVEQPYVKFMAYQRVGKDGEVRLAGKVSVGFGGHVDLADVVQSNSVINLAATLQDAKARELTEEVTFNPELSKTDELMSVIADSIIIDDSNEVGMVHIGLVNTCFISEDTVVTSNEEGIVMIGFATSKDLLTKHQAGEIELEGWSRLLVERDVDYVETHWLPQETAGDAEYVDASMEAAIAVGTACAADVVYLRTRNRWTQALEDQLIQMYKDGNPPTSMNDFGVTPETQQALLDSATASAAISS